MIKVKVARTNGKITSLRITGHSGSGPYGHDLVCAGVSAIVVGGASSIENIKSFIINLSEGDALIELKKDELLSTNDGIVLSTILTQLKCIENSYKKFIEIREIL